MDKRTAGALIGGSGLGPASGLGALAGYGIGSAARTPEEKAGGRRKKESKQALREEFGTANLKQIEKIRAREALADAEEYGRKAEIQEARLNDPRFMAQKMAEARRAAVADLSRAPTGGQQAELARAALGGGDARRVAEVARQAGRGQAEATAQAAAQQGFQAGQAAAQAERAMLDQLRRRQDALLASVGEPPTTFAEQTGQGLVTSGVEMGMGALANELDVARVARTYKQNPDVAQLAFDTENA